jgi:hypothetical protein
MDVLLLLQSNSEEIKQISFVQHARLELLDAYWKPTWCSLKSMLVTTTHRAKKY